MIDRAIGVAGVALSILSMVLPVIFPKFHKKWAMGGVTMGVLLLGGAFTLALLPTDAQSQGAINGNCNAVGNNNSNCSTNNYGPKKLVFNDEVGAKLLAVIPKNKRVIVRITGSQSDLVVGMQIVRFLESKGYNVESTTAMMLMPPPSRQLTWDVGNSELIIAPSVQE